MGSSAAYDPNLKKSRRCRSELRMDPDLFDKALEKLWIHGGAVLDYAENVSRGEGLVARTLPRPG